MEGSTEVSSWLRCYRCWSQNLEVQVHYEGIHRIDPETGERGEVVDEMQEAVVQCLECMHDQPHLGFHNGRVEPIEDRWERMIAGTPWVASCTVTVDADDVETCSGPEAGDALSYAAFGDHGTREFFTHVRFHKHDDDRIVVHLLVELYARSAEEATEVLEEAARGAAGDHLAGRGVAPAGLDGRRPALSRRTALAATRLGAAHAPHLDAISASATGTVAGSSSTTKNSRSNSAGEHEVSSAAGSCTAPVAASTAPSSPATNRSP